MRESTHQAQGDELRIYLLGGFRVSVGQRAIAGEEWPLRKTRTLVKLLALAPGHRLHREQLADILWPDLDPKAAAANLRKIVHYVRRTLEGGPLSQMHSREGDLAPTHPARGSRPDRSDFLDYESELVVLRRAGPVWIDLDAFEAAGVMARHARRAQDYRSAIDLYTGDLLPEDRYEEWAAGRREDLRGKYTNLLMELARLYEEQGEYEAAIEALRQVVAADPLHESAHVGLMQVYALAGRSGQALQQYRQLAEALHRELDVEPEEAATSLYQEIVVGQATLFARVEPPKHNLPARLTSFIGRQKEMVEVKRLLSSGRLLTLTGPGGCGKTRLAIEVAADLLAEYPDGVRLVELASLSEPAFVPQAVAAALQMQEEPGISMTESLVGLLDTKQCLLVVDNCEHLIEACAILAGTILRGCPGVKILATSREPLNTPGEAAWPVPSLSLPERGSIPSLESLREHEATHLFVDRATHGLPAFVLRERDAPAIARICRQVDGIPLAIELAAARIKVLSVDQIVERLNDSFRLLAGGSRTGPARHRTLSAAIGWSYNLLPPKEQMLFRRLSVFAGGFTLEGVEAACAGGLIERVEVLDLLAHLVDKSLVGVPGTRGARGDERGPGGEIRYLLLETLRQYGRERLEDHGEAEAAEHRHALYYRALAERAGPQMRGPRQVAWMARLDRDIDNLRAALEWSQHQDANLGLAIVGSLWWFWEARGYQTEGRRWLDALLPRATGRSVTRASALHCGAALAMRQGDGTAALAMLSESLSIFEEAGDRHGVADVLERLGLFSYFIGDYADSRRHLQESLSIFREVGNKLGVGWTLSDLGMVAHIEGDYDGARSLLEESLVHLRECGDRLGLAYALNNLGQLMRVEGNYARAQALLEESLAAAREVDNKPFTGWALLCLGDVARRRGNFAWARACLLEGMRIARDVGYVRHLSQGLGTMGVLAVQQGDNGRGVALIGAAEALHEAVRSSLDADERVSWDDSLAAARSVLGEAGMDAAWAEGQALILGGVRPPVEAGEHEAARRRKKGMEQALEYAQREESTRGRP